MKNALLIGSLTLASCHSELTSPPDSEAIRLEAGKKNAQRVANCNGKPTVDPNAIPDFLKKDGIKITSTTYLPGLTKRYNYRSEDYLAHQLENEGFNLLKKAGPLPQINVEHGAIITITIEKNRIRFLVLLLRTHYEEVFIEFGHDEDGEIMTLETKGDDETLYRIYVDNDIDGTLDKHGSIEFKNGINLTPIAFFDVFTPSDERDYQQMLFPERGLCVDKK